MYLSAYVCVCVCVCVCAPAAVRRHVVANFLRDAKLNRADLDAVNRAAKLLGFVDRGGSRDYNITAQDISKAKATHSRPWYFNSHEGVSVAMWVCQHGDSVLLYQQQVVEPLESDAAPASNTRKKGVAASTSTSTTSAATAPHVKRGERVYKQLQPFILVFCTPSMVDHFAEYGHGRVAMLDTTFGIVNKMVSGRCSSVPVLCACSSVVSGSHVKARVAGQASYCTMWPATW